MEPTFFNFKTFNYVPYSGVQSVMLLFGGIGLLYTHFIFWGAFVLLLSILIFTTHYGIRIDVVNKTYQDYLSVLWIKSGDIVPYQKIEYLFIKPARESQTMNSMVTSRTFDKDTFDGYIKFGEAEKVYLLSNEKKAEVVKKLQEIASALDVGVVDHTQ